MHAGDHEGGAGVALHQVHVHPGPRHQQPHYLQVTHPRSQDQGRETVLILRIHLTQIDNALRKKTGETYPQPCLVKKQLHHVAMVVGYGLVQGADSVPVRGVDVDVGRGEQQLHHGVVAAAAGVAQRRVSVSVAVVNIGLGSRHQHLHHVPVPAAGGLHQRCVEVRREAGGGRGEALRHVPRVARPARGHQPRAQLYVQHRVVAIIMVTRVMVMVTPSLWLGITLPVRVRICLVLHCLHSTASSLLSSFFKSSYKSARILQITISFVTQQRNHSQSQSSQ